MDIRPYLAPIFKWWWLLLAAAALATGTAYFILRDQPAVYTARTTLMIGRTLLEANPSSNDFWLNQQLSGLYADMAYREPVQEGVKKALGMTWLPKYVVKTFGNGQFLEIDVIDTSPERAMHVASELANQLILVSPGSRGADSAKEAFTEDQLKKTQEQIVATEKELVAKQESLGGLTSAHEIEQAKAELKTLEDKLSLLRTNYANLLSSSKTNVTNILQVIEPASLPVRPTGPNRYLIIALCGMAGLVLGGGCAYLLEYLDEAIQNPDELARLIDAPIVGYISDLGRKANASLYVARHPRSLMAEAFRTLRANIELQNLDNGPLALLITSPDTGDGKTSVAANLAVSFSQGGKKVILVDGDLRKPSLHEFFEISDRRGLTDILQGRLSVEKALRTWDGGGLRLITVGDEAVLPDLLLTAEKVENLLCELKPLADIILIDSSPFLVSDAMIFAAKVDGVIAVIRPGYTSREMARVMKERIAMAGGKIIGVVLNRIPLKRIGYYGGYRYYLPYGYYEKKKKREEDEEKKVTKKSELNLSRK